MCYGVSDVYYLVYVVLSWKCCGCMYALVKHVVVYYIDCTYSDILHWFYMWWYIVLVVYWLVQFLVTCYIGSVPVHYTMVYYIG